MTKIFLSRPTWVGPEFEKGLENFIKFLRSQDLDPRTIGTTDKPVKPPMEEVIDLMNVCQGAIILGYPQIVATAGFVKTNSIKGQVILSTEWNHIETGLAFAKRMPILLIHDPLIDRGVFSRGAVSGFLHGVDLRDPAWALLDGISGAVAAWKSKVLDYKVETATPAAKKQKPMEAKYVTIGELKKGPIVLEILARAVRGEKAMPSSNEFLKRISFGRPYCPTCARPLNETNAGWMADFAQIGYTCKSCSTVSEERTADLHDEAVGQVRKDYPVYYKTYASELEKLEN